jgi:hypothetical protein
MLGGYSRSSGFLGQGSPSDGLGICGPSCIYNATLGQIVDAFDDGLDAFNTALKHLSGEVQDAINSVKHGVFDAWVQFAKLHNVVGKEFINAFNAAYDGVIEIAKYAWDAMAQACKFFREYKAYINIGVQVAAGDYANAAANLAEVAQEALGVPVIVQGTDNEIVQAAEFVCAAIDGLAVVAALSQGVPVPPPLAPSNDLVIVDGVAVPRPKSPLAHLKEKYGVRSVAVDGGGQVAVKVPQAPRSSAPTIIIGASAVAALFILTR